MTYHVTWIRDNFTREVKVNFYEDEKFLKSKIFIFDNRTTLESIDKYLEKYCAR